MCNQRYDFARFHVILSKKSRLTHETIEDLVLGACFFALPYKLKCSFKNADCKKMRYREVV